MENNPQRNYADFSEIEAKPVTEETATFMGTCAVGASGEDPEKSPELITKYTKNIVNYLNTRKDINFHLLYTGGIPVTGLGLNFYYDLTLSNIAFVYSIYVPQEHRRKGYGSKAMYYCYHQSVLNNAHHVFFDVSEKNKGAIAAYEKLGCRKAKKSHIFQLFEGDLLNFKEEEIPSSVMAFIQKWPTIVSEKVKEGGISVGKVNVIDALEPKNRLRIMDTLYREDLTKFNNLLQNGEGIKFENFVGLFNSQLKFGENFDLRMHYLENGELLGFVFIRYVSHSIFPDIPRVRHVFFNEKYKENKVEFFEFVANDLANHILGLQKSILIFFEEGINEEKPELYKKFEELRIYSWPYNVYEWDLRNSYSRENFVELMKI